MKPTTKSTGAAPVSTRVIEAVAAATNRDPTDLEPLFSRIDPDALDSLFADGGTAVRETGQVTFPMGGCEVTVEASGSVDVEPLGEHQETFGVSSAERNSAAAESPD